MERNVYFIGARASGKTTVARLAARLLECSWVDTDDEVVRRAGMEIAELVASRGWTAFRELEAAVLADMAAGPPLVVACGGGMVLRRENRELLGGGLCVYLKASAEELAARLAADPKQEQRPSLTGRALVDEVAEVLAERQPIYLECADLVLEDLSPEDAAEAVARAVNAG